MIRFRAASNSSMMMGRGLRRLVEQHEPRVEDERSGDGQHLLFAPGELVAEAGTALLQPGNIS